MRIIKPLLDKIIGLMALVVLSPLLLGLALLVRLNLGSPILFYQQRPGLHGKPFQILKFRTMNDAKDATGNLLPDAERLTPFGKFLRSTSLDELPELWNVVKGDMSMVGPRPLLMEYLPLYNARQTRRHEVRPGLTGWAQVNGRNNLRWEARLEMDVWYIDNQSFWLDLKILWMTLWTVLKRRGINREGCATMEPFRGSGQSS
jgi:sugar transferase EpsL